MFFSYITKRKNSIYNSSQLSLYRPPISNANDNFIASNPLNSSTIQNSIQVEMPFSYGWIYLLCRATILPIFLSFPLVLLFFGVYKNRTVIYACRTSFSTLRQIHCFRLFVLCLNGFVHGALLYNLYIESAQKFLFCGKANWTNFKRN